MENTWARAFIAYSGGEANSKWLSAVTKANWSEASYLVTSWERECRCQRVTVYKRQQQSHRIETFLHNCGEVTLCKWSYTNIRVSLTASFRCSFNTCLIGSTGRRSLFFADRYFFFLSSRGSNKCLEEFIQAGNIVATSALPPLKKENKNPAGIFRTFPLRVWR